MRRFSVFHLTLLGSISLLPYPNRERQRPITPHDRGYDWLKQSQSPGKLVVDPLHTARVACAEEIGEIAGTSELMILRFSSEVVTAEAFAAWK